jgi:beta-lactamase class D
MKWAFMILMGLSSALHAQVWDSAPILAAMGQADFYLLLDDGTTLQSVMRGLDVGERFNPCSTYKLPHALMGLEAGVIKADSIKRCDPKECHDNHGSLDLKTAIQVSCVSWFRQLARALGKAREEALLARIGYPCKTITGPLDSFWLSGDFRVSAYDQMAWIRRFYTEDLNVKPEHLATVRAMSFRSNHAGWRIFGKTGSSTESYGWFVGKLEKGFRRIFVTLFLEGDAPYMGLEAEGKIKALLQARAD